MFLGVLSHELGHALRNCLPKHSVRFEQPYTNLGFSGSFTKKEIDLTIKTLIEAILLVFLVGPAALLVEMAYDRAQGSASVKKCSVRLQPDQDKSA